MNKKLVRTRKTFRLIAAYSRLPSEGRTALDRLVGYLGAIEGGTRNYHKTKKKASITAVVPKAEVLGKP
jgi:hypothetical protein